RPGALPPRPLAPGSAPAPAARHGRRRACPGPRRDRRRRRNSGRPARPLPGRLRPPARLIRSASTSMPPADTFEYDVFISYRHLEPDRSWVRRELVPRLDEAGLRVCIDVRSFRLGHPIVTEMGRAIEESRYTVAVLTPAFTQSGFTE